MSERGPAPRPCVTCPYRRDVPSGVWDASEYDKLPAYDLPIDQQAMVGAVGAFFCHQQDGRLCAGWVSCHDMEENLGLRVAASAGALDAEDVKDARNYESPVPLWDSGKEARDHGMAEYYDPGFKAVEAVDRLRRKQRSSSSTGR